MSYITLNNKWISKYMVFMVFISFNAISLLQREILSASIVWTRGMVRLKAFARSKMIHFKE